MADLSITAASVLAGATALVEHGEKAGATLVAGQVVYKDNADFRLKLSDNDSGTPGVRTVLGITLNGGAAGQPVSIVKKGPVTLNAVLTAGVVYGVSSTPGGIAPLADVASGDDVIILGVALSTTVLDLQINDTGVTL
ncbi:hypothetical protein [Reyranella sp.]|uniref:hypothetical protein n=1 Tax=Reyranella sp. TaxID=1929291 RepID=UPI0040367429